MGSGLGNGRLVVVADDEPVIRELVSRGLEAEGFRVEHAADGHQVAALLRERAVDLLITDIGMPGMNGLEVVDLAREISPHTSSIIITGNASLETARGATRLGACDYLVKPFTSAELVRAAQAALIRKANDMDRVRQRELADLCRLSEQVRTAEDPWEMLRLTTATALAQSHSDLGMLAVLREGELWPYVLGNVRLEERLQALDSADLARVASQQGAPILLTSVNPHPLAGFVTDIRSSGSTILGPVSEALFLPLCSGKEPRGALALARSASTEPYSRSDLQLLLVLSGHLGLLLSNIELVDKLQRAYVGTVRAMALMLEARDRYTRGHSARVADLCWRMAHTLELGPKQAEDIRIAADLHDVGKLAVPDCVLNKPGRLTEDEWSSIRQHPIVGAQILEPAHFLDDARPLVLYHHERYDGTGYPNHARDDDLSPLAHIIIAADAWDAMTSDRPYRPALDHDAALRELELGRARQFHPEIVDTMISLLAHAA